MKISAEMQVMSATPIRFLTRLRRKPTFGLWRLTRLESRRLRRAPSRTLTGCEEIDLDACAWPTAHFAKLWSAVANEPPLWEGGGRLARADFASIPCCATSRFHHPPKAVALPPHSKVLRTKLAPLPQAINAAISSFRTCKKSMAPSARSSASMIPLMPSPGSRKRDSRPRPGGVR